MKKLLFYFILTFAIMQAHSQTPKPQIKDWHYLDFATDGYQGISLKQAYDLLKGKKSKTVIVAVIDSGIDTLHNDIPFWKNKGEIPNNKIDDDKNGLVDDVIGWNYLGSPTGENLSISVSDIYRTYYRFKTQFEGKAKEDIAKEMQFTFSEWLRAKEKIESKYKEAIKNIDVIKENFEVVTETNEILKTFLKKDVFSNADIINAKSKKKEVASSLKIWIEIFNDKSFTSADYIKDFKQFKTDLEEDITKKTVLPTDHRGILLQDDSYDITKKHYGNNNMQTHSGYHGTSVSSIIGALRGNGLGIDGVADNVKIMMIRGILGKDEFDKDVALSIRYAVDHGAQVINMSFGKYISPDKIWTDEAVKYALSKDVVIVHASGNDAINVDEDFNYPCALNVDGSISPNFINVGASGDYSTGGLIANFSNYGKKQVDVFAPGVAIHCAIANNGTQVSSGTSMAAPVVSGIAAILKSYFPKLTATQIVDIIKKSGTEIIEDINLPGSNKKKIKLNEICNTGKIVNAAAAIKLAMELER